MVLEGKNTLAFKLVFLLIVINCIVISIQL